MAAALTAAADPPQPSKEVPVRRIVVIAAGMSGISCATRIKHSLPDCELNVIVPVPLTAQRSPDGPAGRRYAAELPHPDLLDSREIAILEASDIMPDLARREIVLGSTRGNLTIRYTDLVIEVPATVRLPRALQQAKNVFSWPAPGFTANPESLDAALLAARENGQTVVVTGNGPSALDAVFLVREAGAKAVWLRTGEKNAPGIEPQLLALILKHLGPDVSFTDLPDIEPGQFTCRLSSDKTRLESIAWPEGGSTDVACCLWTSPLMARHPLLREDGVILDAFGRIEAIDEAATGFGLHLMGSGAALPAACLADGTIEAPIYPGGEEAASLSISLTMARLLDPERKCRIPLKGTLGARTVSAPAMCLCTAGFTLAEAQGMGLEADQAVVSTPLGGDSPESSRLVLILIGDKKSRTLLGFQILGTGARAAAARGVFSLALAAMADGTSLETLRQREWSGLPARLLGNAAFILTNKFDTVVQGISPDEFVASQQAGAEFFTLDLRSRSEWIDGHLPGAYNIPLLQLKKRLQDEVPRFTPLVLICATGDDSHAAAARLAALGASDLYVLDGGMDLWPYPTESGA